MAKQGTAPNPPNQLEWPGIMEDGSYAPANSDKLRLDWFERNPGKVKNLKGGVTATDIKTQWQPSVRAAIDAAMAQQKYNLHV
ncbi:MAG: hypothetical protein Q7S87_00905 [Agitococcus sp.]|nr:hypothetical protein [Agitococcus sp.]